MMVYKDHADGMVSGAAHTTQHTILPALQFIKTKPNLCSFFYIFYVFRGQSFGFEIVLLIQILLQLAEIALSADSSLALVLNQNRHVFLFFVSSGDEVDKVRTATEIVRQNALI
jgi:phosphate acetyltransferase